MVNLTQPLTILSVIAEIERSKLEHPDFSDEKVAMAEFVVTAASWEPKFTHAEMRKFLLRTAAVAIRVAEETYPGDGLDLSNGENKN
jgi:hypothetical protein